MVIVYAGFYDEEVQISKTLTLKGAKAGVDARTRSTANESIINNACGPVQIMANNVVIDGFTIQGSTNPDPCYLAGIWTNPGFSGTQGGHQILNNIIQNNISGIELDNTGTLQTKVQFNLIQNNNNAGPGSGNGIQTNFGLSNALIDNNTFVGQTNSSILLLFGSSPITISNNTLDTGITMFLSSGIAITGNTSVGNTVSGTIYLGGAVSMVTVNDNILDGGVEAIVSEDLYSVGANSGVAAHNNCISGNSTNGLRVASGSYLGGALSLNATNNWWGAASGPNYNGSGPGTGDHITDPDGVVAYSPFLMSNATTPCASAPSTVYVDDSWVGTTPGTDPDGAGPATSFGFDSFATIQDGVNNVATAVANRARGGVNSPALAGPTVIVNPGTYDEDISISDDNLSLLGADPNTTIIRGVIGGDSATIHVLANNVTIAGFTITRLGNTVADWNDPGLNSAGIAVQGQAITNMLVRDNIITGNRTGIDVNNSNGHTIRNNVINDNRTGLIFRNQTDNMTVEENFISNNWTVGILFLDGSGGTNVPPQSAHNSTLSNNDLSANWYGQIVDRQSGGSIPAPGTTNLKNFRGNWFGTATPSVTTANSMEPGYAGQIPVEFGGTATNPGGQPDIEGPASDNFKIDPVLTSGTDTNIETTPGRGTNGFQGVANTVVVSPADQHGWAFFDDDPGVGTGSGSFVAGPGTPPLGVGSARLQVDDMGRFALGTVAYAGTRMSDITGLIYNSYQNNNANTVVAPSIQFDIDYDLNDASNNYEGRLVFEPYLTPPGTVLQNVWQNWDARAGRWYGTRTTVTVNGSSVPNPCTQGSPCTWNQVLASFPNAGVRNTPASTLLFKAGGPWAPGFDGNVDALTVQVNDASAVYDFEPTYTLTYTAGPNGSISGTTPQTVNYGADGTPVTAVPNTGYHFVNWSDHRRTIHVPTPTSWRTSA